MTNDCLCNHGLTQISTDFKLCKLHKLCKLFNADAEADSFRLVDAQRSDPPPEAFDI